MKINLIIFLSVILFSCQPEVDVQSIVDKAYAAHGKALWDDLSALHYEKQSTVYNADGSVRVNSLQQHHYEFGPEFWAIVHWESDGEAHEINYTDAGAKKYVNEEQVMDQNAEASAYEAVNAARYTVSQPFKLNDPGVVLSYEGEEVIEDSVRVHVVKAS